MKFGDVYLYTFPFTSGETSKVRPALVLFDLVQDVIICRITSSRKSAPLDVLLDNWSVAGLLKPSRARVDRVITADKRLLSKRLGQLSAADLEAVRAAWNSQMVL